MIDDFDQNDKVLLENIGNVLNQYPNFQLLRVLYLKSIKSQNSKDFDKALSHASISTYDRELLYEFLDTDIIPNKIKEEQNQIELGNKVFDENLATKQMWALNNAIKLIEKANSTLDEIENGHMSPIDQISFL